MEEARQEEEESLSRRILHDLGFFGHYLHMHAGGRSGKQHILTKLHRSAGQLSQRELLEQASISSASLSEVLAKLEAEGLVRRDRSDEDRRQLVISLTEAGTEAAIAHHRAFEAFESECLTCLSEEEQGELLELLDRLAEHWRDMERKGECV